MTTKRDYVKEHCERAIAAFAQHELVDNREDRWRICKREKDGKFTNVHAAEIVSLWGGRIYVGGDIDDCVFAYYGDRRDHRSKLEWMGKCQDVGYYVRQKAAMGLTDGGKLVDTYDAQVAEDDLAYYLEQELAGIDEKRGLTEAECEAEKTRMREVFERAKELTSEQESVLDHLDHELGGDAWEWIGTLGVTVSYRVVYAWAALRRLCELLDAEDAKKQPELTAVP